MAEMGHTDPSLALSIYAQAMRRDDGEQDRLRALVEGKALATGVATKPETADDEGVETPARPARFERATSRSGGESEEEPAEPENTGDSREDDDSRRPPDTA